jgi:hypothetical protein
MHFHDLIEPLTMGEGRKDIEYNVVYLREFLSRALSNYGVVRIRHKGSLCNLTISTCDHCECKNHSCGSERRHNTAHNIEHFIQIIMR